MDQRKLPANLRITFSPLTGNRLRCNWNGVAIKQGQRHAAASRRWSELHPHAEAPKPVRAIPAKAVFVAPPPLPKPEATIGSAGYVECPNTRLGSKCNYWQRADPGETRCISCGKPFIAVQPKPVAETPKPAPAPAKATAAAGSLTARAWNSFGDVDCPNCETTHTDKAPKGKSVSVACSCGTTFTALSYGGAA